jgi:adenine-specific DNA-methyltransferase
LLVMCGAFRVKNLDDFHNLTVKKIPKAVMNRCEWGKDDYSLEIKSLQVKEIEPVEDKSEAPPKAGGKNSHNPRQGTLFDPAGGKGGKRND